MLDGKYVLRERIGQGGMSSVFLADQPALERTVAIKILRSDVEACRDSGLVHGEAVAACRIRSPHCVAVMDCSVLADGTPYLVMEYVPGRPLERIIREEQIPVARVVHLFEQVLSALGAAHDSGIVHGDVKSDNFMVELIGGHEHVTMIDFGLARVAAPPAHDRLQEGAPIMGTPDYMAPEVVRGEPPTHASDLYSAGVILYELLTATTPFGGGAAAEIAARHVYDIVEPPSLRRPDRAISTAFDELVLRALDKRPAARFPDAATFARELRAARRAQLNPRRNGRPTPARPDIAPPATDNRPDRIEQLKELRCLLGEALARDDVAQIADGYLAVAQLLRSERRFAAAVQQLEEGIDLLTTGEMIADDRLAAVSRLKIALAAFHEAGVARQGGPVARQKSVAG
ncbi:MAG TPA: serine/threonine-protein kinase [Kofleriaceae bacterium]